MILQELNKLYDRLKNEPEYNIPVPGYSLQKISFVVVLRKDGSVFGIQDARKSKDKKMIPQEMLVPGGAHPSGSGFSPRFLWDNAAYLFGFCPPPKNLEKPTAAEAKEIARAPRCFAATQKYYAELREKISDPEFQAVANFIEKWNPETDCEKFREQLSGAAKEGFGVFKIQGETHYVHENSAIKSFWENSENAPSEKSAGGNALAMCLISGKICVPAKLHEPAIKGVAGAQSSGAMIVSFHQNSFTSYGFENGENAPASAEAVNRYCNALNALLRSKEKHCIRLGDTTVVFWTGEKTVTEELISGFISPNAEIASDEKDNADDADDGNDYDEDDADEDDDKQPAQDSVKLQRIQTFLENLRAAGTPEIALDKSGISDDPKTSFFMLGISPNAARLSIRFWHAGTLGGFLEKLKNHHAAMHIQKRGEKFRDPDFIPLRKILRQTARDAKNIPPFLGGALMQAILEGTPYPTALMQLIINRLRIDDKEIYVRAAFIKAFLTRNKKQNIAMSLDSENKNSAYLLGRLFSVLEKAQTEAGNKGIRERFYASASATPRTVFPTMLRMFPHHIAKLDSAARRIFFDKLVQEIVDGIDPVNGFPAHLNLDDQGRFSLGYYQQKQSFFTKKSDVPADETQE